MAVWGDPTDLNANPMQVPTLRPCKRCSDMFKQLPEVKPETLILSASGDLSVCELYTVKELDVYYQKPNSNRPISEVPTYSLADDMDDTEYQQEIFIPYLLPKIRSLYPNPI
jgi:hypothetical protein